MDYEQALMIATYFSIFWIGWLGILFPIRIIIRWVLS